MINAPQFRRDFCEFADTMSYTDWGIAYWLNIAELLLRQERWGASALSVWPDPLPEPYNLPKLSIYDHATELFVAHSLVLEARAKKGALAGGIPGVSVGVVNSKRVDKVSIGYDTQIAFADNAGHWNLTIYGQRYWQLVQMFGAGPVQVGTGGCWNYGAWPGVIYGPPY